ncbi:hypothetical protein AHF37_00998 [Paragonimus kellicotti]|nr:hypothetical protein AHF37_00998 [Paragonimus kellicotti]
MQSNTFFCIMHHQCSQSFLGLSFTIFVIKEAFLSKELAFRAKYLLLDSKDATGGMIGLCLFLPVPALKIIAWLYVKFLQLAVWTFKTDITKRNSLM